MLTLSPPGARFDPDNERQVRSQIELEDRKNVKVGQPFRVPVVLPGYEAANLPSVTSNEGGLAYVTDATATTRHSTVAGGGANKVVVYSNGTNWIIM